MSIVVRRLRWDRETLAQVARHRVTPEEVEEVCHGRPLALRDAGSRLILIGPTKADRALTVVIAPHESRTADVYEIVTARPATRRERRRAQTHAAQSQEPVSP